MPIRDDETIFSNDESRAKNAGCAFITSCVTTRCGEEASKDCTHCIGIGGGHRSPFGTLCGTVRGADTLLDHEYGDYTRCDPSDEFRITRRRGAAESANK